ncbi:MAG: hypothetical protein WC763_01015 [Candidatus Paceibacterota bacterium]|jgi:hypothetical protein
MEENSVQEQKVLKPHKYPLWINLFSVVIVLVTLYSIVLSPHYISAAKNLKKADMAQNVGDYNGSIGLYGQVLKDAPDSRKAHIHAAMSFFANGDPEDDDAGLYLIKDITFDKYEWEKMVTVMPQKYLQYFENTPNL